MHKKKYDENIEILAEARLRGVEQAIDLSIRTGVPLVVEKNGKIFEIPPKYKYVRVLIDEVEDQNRSLR